MKPLSEQTLYEILEVPDDAPPNEIEKAYERVRSLYGPGALATYTLMAPDEMALLGRRIEEARSVLLDPAARAGYDARLGSGTPRPTAGRTDDSTPAVQATPVAAFVAPETATTTASPPVPPPPRLPQPDAPAAGGARSQAAAPPFSWAAARGDVPPPPAAAVPPQPSAAVPPQPSGAVAPPPAPAAAPFAPAATPPPATPPFAAVAAPAAGPERPAPEVPAARPADRPTFTPEGGRWTGETLRRAREARGLTVAQLAERTKITRHHIENVEAEHLEQLPAPVYLRGIVMSMARELRLDAQRVARAYLEHVAAASAGPR